MRTYTSVMMPEQGKNRDFGILLKGKSIEVLPRFADRFNVCFVVNSFQFLDEFMETIRGKRILFYSNRLCGTRMPPEWHKKHGVRDVFLTLTEYHAEGDAASVSNAGHYRKIGVRVHWMPESLLPFCERFRGAYATKHPNTGVLALTHAAHVFRPAHLWIAGLDFYATDYWRRRDQCAPLSTQQAKMERVGIPQETFRVIREHPDTMFHIASYYEKWPDIPNLEIIR